MGPSALTLPPPATCSGLPLAPAGHQCPNPSLGGGQIRQPSEGGSATMAVTAARGQEWAGGGDVLREIRDGLTVVAHKARRQEQGGHAQEARQRRMAAKVPRLHPRLVPQPNRSRGVKAAGGEWPGIAATVERSHVHLCFIDPRDETCALHHVDVAALFQSEPDPDQGAMDVGALELPPHAARFQRPPDPLHTTMGFHLLGRDKVAAVDGLRWTLIYAAANGAVRAGPMLCVVKRPAVSASVGGGLYLLDHIPRREERRCFEALLHAPLREDGHWHRLPQPPYVREPGYTPPAVVAHAIIGDAIWTSTKGGVGTYSFDTRCRAWKKEGGWACRSTARRSTCPSAACGSASPPPRTDASAPQTSPVPASTRRLRCAAPGRTSGPRRSGSGATPRSCTWDPASCAPSGSSAPTLPTSSGGTGALWSFSPASR
ncbi:hypothetical protein ACP4OV_008141 [Aristida adscensionis]